MLLPQDCLRISVDGRNPDRPGITPELAKVFKAKKFCDTLRGCLPSIVAAGLAFWRSAEATAQSQARAPQADECERAAEKWAAEESQLHEATLEIEACSTIVHALCGRTVDESKEHMNRNADYFDYNYDKERSDYTGDPDDFCYVRFVKFVEPDMHVGYVMATSNAVADKWEHHAQAKRITEDEAQAYADRQKQIAGKWMDDPKWRSFTGNYRRVRTAKAVHRAA